VVGFTQLILVNALAFKSWRVYLERRREKRYEEENIIDTPKAVTLRHRVGLHLRTQQTSYGGVLPLFHQKKEEAHEILYQVA
jgi:fatty acid-binding protein DegV